MLYTIANGHALADAWTYHGAHLLQTRVQIVNDDLRGKIPV